MRGAAPRALAWIGRGECCSWCVFCCEGWARSGRGTAAQCRVCPFLGSPSPAPAGAGRPPQPLPLPSAKAWCACHDRSASSGVGSTLAACWGCPNTRGAPGDPVRVGEPLLPWWLQVRGPGLALHLSLVRGAAALQAPPRPVCGQHGAAASPGCAACRQRRSRRCRSGLGLGLLPASSPLTAVRPPSTGRATERALRSRLLGPRW